jgi:hypothetical protein
VPAYRCLLREHDVEPAAIVDYETFAARCPILTKANTFDRFPIDQLCAGGTIGDLADVLTSSGHGGRFSFGLSTRRQRADAPAMIDAGFCRSRTGEVLARIDEVLAWNPDARVFAITLGANDPDAETYRRDLDALVARIQAAGRIAVVARLPYQTKYGAMPEAYAVYGYVAADLTVQGLKNAGKDLTLDSFIKGLEAIKGYKDIFNGPQVSFGPNIRQGANSSFLAEVKGGKWTRVTEPLGY